MLIIRISTRRWKTDGILKAERLKRVRQDGLSGFIGSFKQPVYNLLCLVANDVLLRSGAHVLMYAPLRCSQNTIRRRGLARLL